MDGSTQRGPSGLRAPSSRLRVVHVGPDRHGRGGMAAVLRDIETSPLARDHDLAFIASWHGERSAPGRATSFLEGLLRLTAWSAGPRGIVHVHTAVRGSWTRKAAYVLLASATGHATILHVHAGAPDIQRCWAAQSQIRRRLMRWAFNRADRLVTVSAAGATVLRRVTGRADVPVIPNAAPAHASQIPSLSSVPGDRVGVLYLGGFEDAAKGGTVLLDALPAMTSVGTEVDVVLAGPGSPPAEAAPMLRNGSGARWHGWLDERAKAEALQRSAIVTFPSLSEGLPVALLEAMAAGRAVVAARVGGMPELLTDGVDGLLVEPGDPAALAAAVRRLAADPEARALFGERARARVTRLNHEKVYGEVDRHYRQLAEGTPRAIFDGQDGNGRRAVLVCSPGGHLQQMLALRPAWDGLDVTWATLESTDVGHLLAGERVALGHGPTNRSIPKLLRNVSFAWRTVRRHRPDVILSTGAGLAVPFFLVGRILGVRLVYVESLTRTRAPSLTGKLVAPLAHEFFVQWPGAVRGRAKYIGSIL